MKKKQHITFVMTAWGRQALTGVAMAYYANMRWKAADGKADVDASFVLAGSEDWAAASAEKHGWHYVKCANKPLSDKWNAACRKARELDPDAIMIVGSDDFVSDLWVRECLAAAASGSGVVVSEDMVIYDLEKGDPFGIKRAHPGAGTLITADVLERVKWEPYPAGENDMLDSKLMNRLHKAGYPCNHRAIKDPVARGAYVVDVKGPENMWPADYWKTVYASRIFPVDRTGLDRALAGVLGGVDASAEKLEPEPVKTKGRRKKKTTKRGSAA